MKISVIQYESIQVYRVSYPMILWQIHLNLVYEVLELPKMFVYFFVSPLHKGQRDKTSGNSFVKIFETPISDAKNVTSVWPDFEMQKMVTSVWPDFDIENFSVTRFFR